MKNFVITGYSSGIGHAVALKLNNPEFHLYLLGRDSINSKLLELKLDSKITFIECDLEDIDNIKYSLVKLPSLIDGFVHCAGVTSTIPINKINYEKFEYIFKINMYSFIEILKWIANEKKTKSEYWTSVVGVSSIASVSGGIGQTLYSASKAALEASVMTLSKELFRKKIRINSVRPGLVDTPMTRAWMHKMGIDDLEALNRLQLSGVAKPSDIADVICFLIDSSSKHIVGQNINVDGGGQVSGIF
jgi:NAD(P)-dependent dehydrogenase (short-subunit alcohol dehydrogenase family)